MQRQSQDNYEFLLEAMIGLCCLVLFSILWSNKATIQQVAQDTKQAIQGKQEQTTQPTAGNEKAILPLPRKNMRPPGPRARFGWRIHPVHGQRQFHTGHDIGSPEGTPIYAIFSGKVTFAGHKGACGNTVIINSGDYIHTYCHIMPDGILVRDNQAVKQGDVIAKVGTTGRSTGFHLHLGIKYKGQNIDPLKVLPGRWY